MATALRSLLLTLTLTLTLDLAAGSAAPRRERRFLLDDFASAAAALAGRFTQAFDWAFGRNDTFVDTFLEAARKAVAAGYKIKTVSYQLNRVALRFRQYANMVGNKEDGDAWRNAATAVTELKEVMVAASDTVFDSMKLMEKAVVHDARGLKDLLESSFKENDEAVVKVFGRITGALNALGDVRSTDVDRVNDRGETLIKISNVADLTAELNYKLRDVVDAAYKDS